MMSEPANALQHWSKHKPSTTCGRLIVVMTAFILIFMTMAKKGKKYLEAKAKVPVESTYALPEAVALVKDVSYSKFV